MAEVKFLADINLNNNQLVGVKLQNLTSDPSGLAGEGQIYYDSNANVIKFHTGSDTWVSLSSASGDITSVVAGDGLTGGATSGAATVNVVGGDGITANANDVAITATQGTITSILNADLVVGRDAHNQIQFTTDNEIHFKTNNETPVIKMKASGEIEATKLDGALEGNADSATVATTVTITDNENTDEENAILFSAGADTDGGNLGVEQDHSGMTYNPSSGTISATTFKGNIDAVDGDFDGTLEADAITIAGTAIGSIYGVVAGSSSIVTTGALNSGSITAGFGTIDTGSSAITTTGLISGGSLDIDHVLINGTTIGHTDDTDLITLADGIVTVAGEISVTTLDIGGTNISATATELNYTDLGSTAVGTAIASKAVVLDSNKDYTGLRNVTLSGELDTGSLDVSGNADIDGTLECDALTIEGTAIATVIAGTTVSNATLAATVTVTNSTTNANYDVPFTDGSAALLEDNGAFYYNPSTGLLTVPNLSVAGTTTQVNTVTMNAQNAVVFEGATADAHETTLSIVDPTADHTQYLINQGGYIPVLAASTTTAITSTPAELNVLDGVTAGTVSASLAVVVDSNKDIASFRNVTLSGELDAATGDFSGDVDVDGTLEADAITIAGTAIGSIYGVVAGSSSIVTTGALSSGSITSGFGSIDNGSSTITTTGLISGGSLDIDNVLINGTTIGHTDDTDLITLADGVVTVAGELDATSLDISGNADIDGTLEADAITIAGTAISSVLSPVAGHASIATVGTISTGSWAATDIAVAHGGTGASSASAARTNLGVAYANDAETLAGSSSTKVVTPAGLSARSYRTAIGDGSATAYTVNHALGTRDVVVQMYDVSSYETVYAQVVRTDTANITVTFNVAPSSSDVVVLVTKID